MLFGRFRLITNVMYERAFEHLRRFTTQALGESLEYRQVCGAFQIEDPPTLFGLVVLLVTDFLKCLPYLACFAFHPVRFTDERDDHILPGRFVQKHL